MAPIAKPGSSAGLTKILWSAALAAVIAAVLLPVGTAAGDNEGKRNKGAIVLLTTIPVPVISANASKTAGALYSYDISWVDQASERYYLADRSNNVIDVVNAKNSTFVTQISATPPFKGFVSTPDCTSLGGSNCSGPNGVTVSGKFLFATDGGSRVVTIDLTTGNTVGDTVTRANDPNRADELAFDPHDRVLLVINNADNPAFGTLINVAANGALSVAKTIPLPFATNGAEQPVWDPRTKKVLSLDPSNRGEPHGGRGHSHLDHGHGGSDLYRDVLLAGRSRLGSTRGSARRLQYDLGGYGRRVMDRECGQTHPYRSTPISDPECDNGQHRSERAGCGRR